MNTVFDVVHCYVAAKTAYAVRPEMSFYSVLCADTLAQRNSSAYYELKLK